MAAAGRSACERSRILATPVHTCTTKPLHARHLLRIRSQKFIMVRGEGEATLASTAEVRRRSAERRYASLGEIKAPPPAQCIRLERGVRCGGLD
eukprot:scaffold13268_cov122-Isochrysis_galbana.AAC.1